MSYLVKDYMDKEFHTVEESASVTDAAKEISEAGEGYLIVLENGRPKGIVTDEDFVRKVIAQGLDPNKVKVVEIMSSPLITIDPDEDLLKASEIMHKKGVRRLPVVKDGIIYGVITANDIAQRCGEYVERSIRDILKWSVPFGIGP